MVAEVPGDRVAGVESWREDGAFPGERLAQPLFWSWMMMGWDERKGEGESQAGQEGSKGKNSLAERPGAGRKACIIARDDSAQRAASADTEGDLPKVRTAGAGPGNK